MNNLISLVTAHPGIAVGVVAGMLLTVIWHAVRRIERLFRTVAVAAIAGGGLAAGGGAAAGNPSVAAATQFVSNLLHLH
ncbi:MAG: hypothetical protein WCE30_03375 [Mycobacterium sp.]